MYFLCSISPWRWPKEADTCSKLTTRSISLYLNISTVVYIYKYMVTYLTAWNMDNFKLSSSHSKLYLRVTDDVVKQTTVNIPNYARH